MMYQILSRLCLMEYLKNCKTFCIPEILHLESMENDSRKVLERI